MLPSVWDAVDSLLNSSVITLSENTNTGWNLFSFPVDLNNESAIQFPVGTSSLMRFDCNTGYIIEDTLTSGKGYWVKFPSEGRITISGTLRTEDTIDVNWDWNLIGSLTQKIDVDSVLTLPAGIISSPFFGYVLGKGYYVTDTLRPFQAYWVKVSEAGKILLQ